MDEPMIQTKSKKYGIASLKLWMAIGTIFSLCLFVGEQRAHSVEYFMGIPCSGYWVAQGAYGGKRCVPGQTYQPPSRAFIPTEPPCNENGFWQRGDYKVPCDYDKYQAYLNRQASLEAARQRALQAARRKAESQRIAAELARRSAIEAARREARRRSNPRCEKDGTKPVYDSDGDLTHYVVCGERALREAKDADKKRRRAKEKREADATKQRKAKADIHRKAKKQAKREAQAAERKRQREAARRRDNEAKRKAAARRARAERKRQAVLARQRVAERKRKAEVKRQKDVRFKRRQRTTQNNRISAELERQKRAQFNRNIAREAGKKPTGSPLIYQDMFSRRSRLEKWATTKSDGSRFKTFRSNLNKNSGNRIIRPGDDYVRALNSPLPTQTSKPKPPVKLEWKRPNSPVPYPLGTATPARPKAASRPSTLPTTRPVIKFNPKNTSPKKDGWFKRTAKKLGRAVGERNKNLQAPIIGRETGRTPPTTSRYPRKGEKQYRPTFKPRSSKKNKNGWIKSVVQKALDKASAATGKKIEKHTPRVGK